MIQLNFLKTFFSDSLIKQIRTTSELWLVEVDIIVTADVLMSDVRSGEMCGGVPGPGPGSRGSSASSTPCASRRSLNFEKINPGLLRSVPHTCAHTCTDTCSWVTLTHTHTQQPKNNTKPSGLYETN